MRVFRTHRELREANNRVLRWFFATMGILVFAFIVALVGRYLLEWW